MIYSPPSQMTHISIQDIQQAIPVNKDDQFIIRVTMRDNTTTDWYFLTDGERDNELDVVIDMISLFGK